MIVIKRDNVVEEFDWKKVDSAITNAFKASNVEITPSILEDIKDDIYIEEGITVEELQDQIEESLFNHGFFEVMKRFILYRSEHANQRMIAERIEYIDKYTTSGDNAATSSETDANANVIMKNVANLEGEVYKVPNRSVQRIFMRRQLRKQFPDLYKQYEKDLDHHIIYTHDEASTPVLKQYCMAVSLYPLMLHGTGPIDGVTPNPPNDLRSFSGQITNLAFLLSAQCKGAVAFGSYFIVLNYYVIAEYGNDWYNKLDAITTSSICENQRTIKSEICKAFKQFVYGINQPAGNRSYQSPFTNISYYDHTYFSSLFGEFYYPDGTQPEWKAIDTLQRLFLKWFSNERLKQVLTFPVETFAMVHDGKDIVDKEYKELWAETHASGHVPFTYISDSADSLASCCRLRNELAENTFNPTSGLTGVMTGSCNVITLNINRILQDFFIDFIPGDDGTTNQERIESRWKNARIWFEEHPDDFKKYFSQSLINILERVYKYHIAYKTMLYDLEDKHMFASSNGGYIYISKLYSTIGINGLNEAARFLGLEVSNNREYINFLQLVLGTIKEQNKKNSINDKKRPFLFNSEVVPAEGLGGKNYRWDKEDGYLVPQDENLYNSYFYNAHDNTSVLDKLSLHGRETTAFCDGGSAAHINLEDHLSKEQYLKLLDFCIDHGTNYFTFNIPISKCNDCGYIVKRPIHTCPKCNSDQIIWNTRIIGYLRPMSAFGHDRWLESLKRIYTPNNEVC